MTDALSITRHDETTLVHAALAALVSRLGGAVKLTLAEMQECRDDDIQFTFDSGTQVLTIKNVPPTEKPA